MNLIGCSYLVTVLFCDMKVQPKLGITYDLVENQAQDCLNQLTMNYEY